MPEPFLHRDYSQLWQPPDPMPPRLHPSTVILLVVIVIVILLAVSGLAR